MRPPMPPPVVEDQGIAPFAGAVWEVGLWVWGGGAWRWQPGGWRDPSRFGWEPAVDNDTWVTRDHRGGSSGGGWSSNQDTSIHLGSSDRGSSGGSSGGGSVTVRDHRGGGSGGSSSSGSGVTVRDHRDKDRASDKSKDKDKDKDDDRKDRGGVTVRDHRR
jgi:hypothetical protein